MISYSTFLYLNYLTYIMPLRSIHVVANVRIFCVPWLSNIPLCMPVCVCVCVCVHLFIHSSINRHILFP